MSIRWEIKEKADAEAIKKLSQELNNLSETLANILLQRDITNLEQARTFFRPDLANTHDPFLMKDMDKAVERLDQAILKNEKILIFGDYDRHVMVQPVNSSIGFPIHQMKWLQQNAQSCRRKKFPPESMQVYSLVTLKLLPTRHLFQNRHRPMAHEKMYELYHIV